MKIVVNPSQIQIPQLSDQELCDLRQARLLLEQPTLVMRMTQHLGRPVERVMEAMPRIIRATIETSSVVALRQATRVATWTLNKKQVRPSSEGFHQVALLVSGGMGGTLGLATLIWELPLSTTLMLRSIADIARSEGHSLRSPETLTSCLEVFAMEGGAESHPEHTHHYWAVRLALAKAVSEATVALAGAQAAKGATIAFTRLISVVAARFGLILSQQAAAK
ncbi:MAG TPA: peptidase, partial [Verrucomicrobiales bacterium]|nr:peptidase [Verrucomicrobiales bacterium]